jgi:hypothetical protein
MSKGGENKIIKTISDFFKENETFMKYPIKIDSAIFKQMVYKKDGTLFNQNIRQ